MRKTTLISQTHTNMARANTSEIDLLSVIQIQINQNVQAKIESIGLYRKNAIATEKEAREPFGGNVYYVTMQITFPIPEFARNERNLHCDVVHVTTKWVSRLVLDHAIAAIQTSR